MPSLNDNTLTTANNLGILSGALDIVETFDSTDRLAFYKFTLTQNSDLGVQVSGNLSVVRLISDINGNGIVESRETINSDLSSFFEPLPTGTYFIQLNGGTGQQNLRLAETPKPGNVAPDPGNSLSQAFDLGVLSGNRNLKDYVGDLDETDFYKFTLTQNSNLGIVINAESTNTLIRIIADRNANGVDDSSEIVASRLFGSSFSTTLSAGTYFIRVGGNSTAQYDLALTQVVDLSRDDVLTGAPNRDVIRGLEGNDTILGLGGNDRLLGDAGNDTLIGGTGNDTLIGGAGNDRLDGEAGNDVITTSAGRDVVVLRRGQGFDRITDFKNNQDKIDLIGISFGQLTLRQQRNDILVKLGQSNLLLIEDTNLRSINRKDFV